MTDYFDYSEIQEDRKVPEKYDYSSDESSEMYEGDYINVGSKAQQQAARNFFGEKRIEKMSNVNLGMKQLNDKISGQMKSITKNHEMKKNKDKDKSDRATVEQCIDRRTSTILAKLRNKEDITKINGCVSAGKEANVYHALGKEGEEYAIKIYKTSILVFKDRERYITGEFRFRHGYCKSNPRKMVEIWAEKEARNLKRIAQSSLKCPTVHILKSNLIIMDFVGEDGDAAPRLKDADHLVDSQEEWIEMYDRIVEMMRILWHECRLVHADFSEYNLLYYKKEIWVIDVAQAVEHDHPYALYFLKRDCGNINLFFKKKGVEVLTDPQLFDIVSALELKDSIRNIVDGHRVLNKEELNKDSLYYSRCNDGYAEISVPRTLEHLDEDKIEGNEIYQKAIRNICGVVGEDDEEEEEQEEKTKVNEVHEEKAKENKGDEEDKKKVKEKKTKENKEDEEEDDEEEEDEDDEEEVVKEKKFEEKIQEMTDKKERKKLVKEYNKEKRAGKMDKKKKDKIIKRTKAGKK